MEEADALSDRIAVIDNGKIECCGSPLFLKTNYGEGYKLTLSKRNDFNESELKKTLSLHLQKYEIETNAASEMAICIPMEFLNNLPSLLVNIEQKSESIGINNYGISSSTIEEVFLK